MGRRAAGAALAVALLAGGCTRGGTSPEVTIRLTDDRLSVQPASAEAGRVRIFIDNETSEEHDLVFAYAQTIEELPVSPDGSVTLEGLNLADQLQPFGPGRYRIEPDLRAGSIVVFCTLPGHLQRGLWAPLRVVGGDPAEPDPVP